MYPVTAEEVWKLHNDVFLRQFIVDISKEYGQNEETRIALLQKAWIDISRFPRGDYSTAYYTEYVDSRLYHYYKIYLRSAKYLARGQRPSRDAIPRRWSKKKRKYYLNIADGDPPKRPKHIRGRTI
jgi:hypothetical protein